MCIRGFPAPFEMGPRGLRSKNGRPCTTNGGDKEDDQGDESDTERPVITWGMPFSIFNLFNFACVILIILLCHL